MSRTGDDAEREPTDVGHPGDAAVVAGEELQHQPDGEQPLGPHLGEEHEEDEDDRLDAGVGMPHEVRAHDRGDGAGGADAAARSSRR